MLALAREAIVERRVTGAGGEPVVGATVRVKMGNESFPDASTNYAGRYRVRGLPPGRAQVELSRTGALNRRARTELREGETALADFVLAAGSIRGRVTEEGSPVAGTSVLVRNLAVPEEQSYVHADGDGLFLITGLPPGRYDVHARGRRGTILDARPKEVEVGLGESVCDIDLSTRTSVEVRGARRGSPRGIA